MPSSLKPVLVVDANVIHEVDTSNAQNLYSMWNVFSSCGDNVGEGRRLENLTWRVWGQVAQSTQTQPVSAPKRQLSVDDIPQLSTSVESAIHDDASENSATCPAVDIARPRIRRQNSYSTARSRAEKHISSDCLEKMVVSIIEQKQPITAPLPEIPSSMSPTSEFSKMPSPLTERSGSTTSEGSMVGSDAPSADSFAASSLDVPRPTKVMRGFPATQPSPAPKSLLPSSSSQDAIPEPKSAPAPKQVLPKKAVFQLGASSGEDSYSDRIASLPQASLTVPQAMPAPEKKIFKVGGSSEDDSLRDGSLKSAMAPPRIGSLLNAQKKQTSFANNIRTFIPTSAIEDDDTESYVDESAIDDDEDGSDWEDSIDESGRSSVDDKAYFQRVDSKVNLRSRRSLLTMEFERQFPQGRLSNLASQSTPAIRQQGRSGLAQPPISAASPNDSDESPLMMRRPARQSNLRPISEAPRAMAQPIMTTTNGIKHQVALSPRTTRKNMLSTELTESLRRHLLWERTTKSSTTNAVLKRRHTAQNMQNLKQYPEKPFMGKGQASTAEFDQNPMGQWFQDAYSNYHTKGW